MRNGFLAALAAVLACHSLAFAQGGGYYPNGGYYPPNGYPNGGYYPPNGYPNGGYHPPNGHAWAPMGRPPAPPNMIRNWAPPGPNVQPPAWMNQQPQQPQQPYVPTGMAGWPPQTGGSRAAYDPSGLVPGKDLRSLPHDLPVPPVPEVRSTIMPQAIEPQPPALLNPAPANTTPVPPCVDACAPACPAPAPPPPPPPPKVEKELDFKKKEPIVGIWGTAEYLMWWFKNGSVPPLVTSGGTGIIGAPGTTTLLDNLNFDNEYRHGGRFSLGYQCKLIPILGLETSFFFVADQESDEVFLSPGVPTLSRPFFNISAGIPDSVLIASPGINSGSIDVTARTSLWAAETNLAAGIFCNDFFHCAVLGGGRYLNMEDEVGIATRSDILAPIPGFGGTTLLTRDLFRTENQFYGGQLGAEFGVQILKFTVDFRGKVAFGNMHQKAVIDGNTTQVFPGGASRSLGGGVLALPTNIGSFDRDELAFIPEVAINFGFQVTPHVKLFTGYSFLWISNVARAGEQIDPTINVTQLPVAGPVGPLVGQPRPTFVWQDDDFWAQGLNFGMELKF